MAEPNPPAPVVAEPAPLHPVNRRHLDELRGPLGIFQHASGATPDPEHGYCVDDVARALQVDLLHARELGWPAVADSAEQGLRFLEDAFDGTTSRFRNFRTVDGAWIGGPASNDSVARAILALGETIASVPDDGMRDRAQVLFRSALPAASKIKSPRAVASIILGLVAAGESIALMRRLATDLHANFLWSAEPGWPWLEGALTYENAVVPRALIVAGTQLRADVMVRIGLQVLDWLVSVQTASAGHFSPIGNGWWERGGARSQFDQQPIEATATLLAAEAALAATGDPRYRAVMELAYGWFLGRNDLRKKVAVPSRGASFDGLTATGVNANQGAESTLMWLMAAEHTRSMRGASASRVPAAPGPSSAPPAKPARAVRAVPGVPDGSLAAATS